MIDREKVIKGLKCIIEGTVRCDSCGYAIDKHGHHSCQQNCASDAIAMLKEREPKPVKITRNAYDHQFYHCPNCGHDFYDFYKKPSFCEKCGQAVKWDEGKRSNNRRYGEMEKRRNDSCNMQIMR